MNNVRVALLEDNLRFARALGLLLRQHGASDFIHYARGPALLEALADASLPTFEVLLCDIGLGRDDGVHYIAQAKALVPKLKVIMLSSFDDAKQIVRAIQAGADGYLVKLLDPTEMAEQISAILGGAAPLSAAVAALLLQMARKPASSVFNEPNLGLSARELEVLTDLRLGKSYKEIARDRTIALDTVRNHIRRVYEKLNVNSARAAIAKLN